ncbi:MAG: TIGR01777 family oxidoreductase [Firmicutes bacterium]|nr:TIGR01777 family oxidoreductase [Bacillota bacterium]
MRTVLVMGGTGLIGQALVDALLRDAVQVIVSGRSQQKVEQVFAQRVQFARYTGEQIELPSSVQAVDAIVNLAGVSLSEGRWTKERKRLILSSRIAATRAAVALIERQEPRVRTLVNASAVGYYGTSETVTFTEESLPVGDDFLASVCRAWEAEADHAVGLGTRVVKARFGVILGRGAGALEKMVQPYRLFAGGPLGSGRQYVSWVHISDAVGLLLLALGEDSVVGPVNVTAPTPVRMNEMGQAIARVLRRPHLLRAPEIALRVALGEMATMVLEGQRVLPTVAQTYHYDYAFATVDRAMRDLLS